MTEVAEKHELQSLIEDLHSKYQPVTDGQVATYIPELAKADPNDFAICIVTEDGRTFEVGDCDRPFTIQLASKPFTFGMALEELGHQEVSRYVGVEPSGDAFNSISLQDEVNRPFNPMINTGAITVTALRSSTAKRPEFTVNSRRNAVSGRSSTESFLTLSRCHAGASRTSKGSEAVGTATVARWAWTRSVPRFDRRCR